MIQTEVLARIDQSQVRIEVDYDDLLGSVSAVRLVNSTPVEYHIFLFQASSGTRLNQKLTPQGGTVQVIPPGFRRTGAQLYNFDIGLLRPAPQPAELQRIVTDWALNADPSKVIITPPPPPPPPPPPDPNPNPTSTTVTPP